jgi:hypothetical protein
MSRCSGVLLAIAASAVAALAPVEAAAAWGGHGWAGHGWHFGHFGHFQRFGGFGPVGRFPGATAGGYLGYYDSPDYSLGCVWARQLVPTPDGPRYRYFPICDGY